MSKMFFYFSVLEDNKRKEMGMMIFFGLHNAHYILI